jgi:hypothetical protein
MIFPVHVEGEVAPSVAPVAGVVVIVVVCKCARRGVCAAEKEAYRDGGHGEPLDD